MKYGMTIVATAKDGAGFVATSDDFPEIWTEADTELNAANSCSESIDTHLRRLITDKKVVPLPKPLLGPDHYFAYATILDQGLIILNNHMITQGIARMDLARIQAWTPGRVNKLFDPAIAIDAGHLTEAMSRYDLFFTLVDTNAPTHTAVRATALKSA